MRLNRKVWRGLTLVASGGIAIAGLAGCAKGEDAEGGEAGAAASQAQGGEAGEGGETGATTPHAEGGESGEQGHGGEGGESAALGNYPGAGFETALQKVLAGEGGEGGIGLVKSQRTLSTPALSEEQIATAVGGNTLSSHGHFAYHFAKSGSIEGWEVNWAQVDMARCASKAPSYHQFDAECWQKSIVEPTARWSVREGMLCTEPAIEALTGKESCGTTFLLFNRFAVYGSDDKMVGKGGELSAGSQLDGKPEV